MVNKLLLSTLMIVGILAVPKDCWANSQEEIMPVLFNVDGKEFPVVAKKDGEFFPVFIVRGSQPYFADKDGNSIYVYDSKMGVEYPVFYVDGKGKFHQIKEAEKPSQTQLTKLVYSSDSKVQLVCWGRNRWYRGWYRWYRIYPYYYYDNYYYRRYYWYWRGTTTYYPYYGAYEFPYYFDPLCYGGWGFVVSDWCW